MQKELLSILTGLLLVIPFLVSASHTTQHKIEEIKAKIAMLQAQIATLKSLPSAVQITSEQVKSENRVITLISPNGGEALERGKNIIIKWNAADSVGTVDLSLLASSTPKHESFFGKRIKDLKQFNWLAGKDMNGMNIPDGNYTMRIRASGTDRFDESDSMLYITTPVSASSTYQKFDIPSNLLLTQQMVLYRLGATANMYRDQNIDSLKFLVQKKNVTIGPLELYMYKDVGFTTATGTKVTRDISLGDAETEVEFILPSPITILMGDSRYFELQTTVLNIAKSAFVSAAFGNLDKQIISDEKSAYLNNKNIASILASIQEKIREISEKIDRLKK